jgi:hypothetical protein
MVNVKRKVAIKKVIWRMSSNSPTGEYLTPDEAAETQPETEASAQPPEPRSSWKLSSLELSDGLQVSEEPMDTLPGDLVDELFKR